MNSDGRLADAPTDDGHVLRWSGRVLAAEDVRRQLNGHAEVVLPRRTIVTPLAEEHLRNHAIRITRQESAEQPREALSWGFAQERPYPLVKSAVQALERDGILVRELPPLGEALPCCWARALAQCVTVGECQGGVIFCHDPGLVCCVANKQPGLRAVPVTTVGQAAQATLTLAANLLAVEMPGRTFFEVRQILRILCTAGCRECPPGVACTLQELDGHAHR